jgi:hypothetical protein
VAEAKKLNNDPTLQVSFLLYLIIPKYFLLSREKGKNSALFFFLKQIESNYELKLIKTPN